MTRRSGSIIAPDITFLMSANVLSNNSFALKIYKIKNNKIIDKFYYYRLINRYFSNIINIYIVVLYLPLY